MTLAPDIIQGQLREEFQKAAKKYPPISPGTTVRTTKPNWDLFHEWTDEAWNERKWGAKGTVLTHHDSHGLCYEVQHEDETVGYYDPSELEVVTEDGVKEKQMAKMILHHDDPPCTARLNDGFCPECRVVPDMQSTCFLYYCPVCDIQVTNDMKCTKCGETFKRAGK